MNYEIIGLIASIFVLVSFIPKEIKWIRCVNIIGCIVWIIYGILSGALSVWIMNLLVMIVHLFHLVKYSKRNNP